MRRIHIDDIRHATPHWFGLGFIQLKLDAETRIHFWHPDLAADVPEEELHDHRYSFRSEILHGTIVHQEYAFERDAEGDHDLIEVSCTPDAEHEPRILDRGRAVPLGRYSMVAGSEYVFPVGAFHRIEAREAITFLTRPVAQKDFARVIRPRQAPAVCPFARKIPEQELWNYIMDMLLIRSKVGTVNQL